MSTFDRTIPEEPTAPSTTSPPANPASLPTGPQSTGTAGQFDPNAANPNRSIDGAPEESSLNSTASNASQAIGNLINTGSLSPEKATLVNPQTGERKAVDVGSQDAQNLFGLGFELEKQAPGASGTGGSANPAIEESKNKPPDKLSFLKSEGDRIRAQAFSSVYGFTPEEWQDQSPAKQRQLRNQRVQGLAKQLGNINTAIETVKAEEASARNTALENLNLAMEFGALDLMDESELSAIASEVGLPIEALQRFGAQTEPPELRSVDGNLYAISWNSETGSFDSELVVAKANRGGGGGGGGRSSGGGGGGSFSVDSSGEESGLTEVFSLETGDSLGFRDIPGQFGGTATLDPGTGKLGNFKEAPKKTADDFFMDFAASRPTSKLSKTERDRLFRIQAGEVEDDDKAITITRPDGSTISI